MTNFTIRPVFDQSPKITARMASSVVGLSSAPRVVGYVGERPLHAFSHNYALKSRAEIDQFRDHFFDMKGRWGNFFVPSWHPELQPLTSLIAGQTDFQITGVNYKTVYGTASGSTGQQLFFLSDAGNMGFGEVVDVTGSNIETISLDEAFEQDFVLGHFMVGFLYKVRLASDSLALKMSGINEATATLSFIETINPFED